MIEPFQAKIFWLVCLIVVLSGLWLILLRVDRSEEWNNARLAQLVINKHGGMDIAAIALWVCLLFNMMVITFVLFHGSMPEGLGSLMTAFNITFGAPMVSKILKGTVDGNAAQPGDSK